MSVSTNGAPDPPGVTDRDLWEAGNARERLARHFAEPILSAGVVAGDDLGMRAGRFIADYLLAGPLSDPDVVEALPGAARIVRAERERVLTIAARELDEDDAAHLWMIATHGGDDDTPGQWADAYTFARSATPAAAEGTTPNIRDINAGLVRELDEARARLARVEALHHPDRTEPAFCEACGLGWPCRTRRALDGTE